VRAGLRHGELTFYVVNYRLQSTIEIERTSEYAKWMLSLRDDRAKAKITLRIDRLMLGNPGDIKPVAEA
jgi:putative component of toxin-antitoxin plasmid stabilization module